MRKKVIIFVFLLILIFCILLFVKITENTHKKTQTDTSSSHQAKPLPTNGTYITEDSSSSPSVPNAAVQATLTRETKQYQHHIWQKFVIANSATGSKRVLFEHTEDNIQFEKMSSQNWSPTNRFFYVLYDFPDNRRNLLIFEIDGRFTNTQYYLTPFQLTSPETVANASWHDDETLYVDLTNLKSNVTGHFEVDLNDSEGKVKQLSR
jgi:hypothetical protein